MGDHATGTSRPREARGGADRRSVRLQLLGGFEVSVDGCVVDLQPAVQRLVAFVALTPRGVERSFAAYQLWPDTEEQRAKANLRSTLWRLKQLDAEVVEVAMTRLRLARTVDVDVRLDLLGGSRSLRDGDAVPPPFRTMLPDLLPDWYDDWLTVERERYRQLHLATLEQRGRDAIAAGDTCTAIQLALAAIAIDGARQSSHRVLVDAHRAEGNESEALREQDRFRRCAAMRVPGGASRPSAARGSR